MGGLIFIAVVSLVGLGFLAWFEERGEKWQERRQIARMARESIRRELRPAPRRHTRWLS